LVQSQQEERMTDKQFQQLFAAQLAQIALLQAIEANVSAMAHKHVPNERIHPNWKKAHEMLSLAMQELAPATE
jgi:hemoglobin-like flavoprotein